MPATPIIVKAEEFDVSKISFKDTEGVNTGGRVNMTKIPLTYEERPLVLQTPVFQRCAVRGFGKKSEGDKVAVVFYQSIKYKDEEFYARDVIGSISNAVKTYIKSNVRSLFQRKKDSVSDLTYYDPAPEGSDTVKTAVPTASRDDMTPAKEVRFYSKDVKELTKQQAEDYLEENKRMVSGRALVSVPYAYVINKQAYGLKNMLCSLQFMEKPEDCKVMSEEEMSSKSGVSGMLDMGAAFC